MLKRAGLLVVALLAASVAAAGLTSFFDLLSGDEYSAELRARAAPGATALPRAADFDAPTITVISPDMHAAIKPPVNIELRFQAAPGATVNPASLKILYGFLKLDVTRRILNAPGVEVSAAGLKASGARLPSGDHKLVVEVADSLGRTAVQPLQIVVL
ncbi:MAG TPA: hypothetical protein VL994_00185 [Steroidobacteraceae bacterium]|nr:hypothetical protein [Steroidobacteraceae bacterium]